MVEQNESIELADLRRRLANLIRIGTISQVNYKNATARVKIGQIETTWLPWLLRDGEDKIWHGVDLKEQVLVLSPSGDLNQGLIIPSIFKEPISDDGNLLKMRFKDGSVVSFNRNTGDLLADITGNAQIKTAQEIIAVANKSVTIKSPTIILDGNVTISQNLTVNEDVNTLGNVSLSGGGPGIARIGDTVSVDATTHQGTITASSEKAKAG